LIDGRLKAFFSSSSLSEKRTFLHVRLQQPSRKKKVLSTKVTLMDFGEIWDRFFFCEEKNIFRLTSRFSFFFSVVDYPSRCLSARGDVRTQMVTFFDRNANPFLSLLLQFTRQFSLSFESQ
jgi:hypothetical protein